MAGRTRRSKLTSSAASATSPPQATIKLVHEPARSAAGDLPVQAAAPPPTVSANHFSMIMTANELVIVCGVSRVMMVALPNGQTNPVHLAEWFQAISTTPQSGAYLRDMLTDALAAYERDFGPLPRDKNSEIKVEKTAVAQTT